MNTRKWQYGWVAAREKGLHTDNRKKPYKSLHHVLRGSPFFSSIFLVLFQLSFSHSFNLSLLFTLPFSLTLQQIIRQRRRSFRLHPSFVLLVPSEVSSPTLLPSRGTFFVGHVFSVQTFSSYNLHLVVRKVFQSKGLFSL